MIATAFTIMPHKAMINCKFHRLLVNSEQLFWFCRSYLMYVALGKREFDQIVQSLM